MINFFIEYRNMHKKRSFSKSIKNSPTKTIKTTAIEKVLRDLTKEYKNATGINNQRFATAKECIQELRSYYETIIAAMPNNVYWLDRNCILRGCNENVAKICNLPIEKCKGLSYEDVKILANLTEQQTNAFKSTDIEIMKTGQPKINVEEPPLPGEGTHPVSYYISSRVPLKNKLGQIVGVVGISTNVTEIKNAEENLKQALGKAEVANQAKTEFLENMRHDIRTPLSGIVGFANLLKSVDSVEKAHEYADNMIASSNSLLEFLNEVLDAIKVASGEIPHIRKKFDLKARLLSVINLNQAKAAEKSLQLSFNYSKKTPQYFLGDPVRLQRIFLELINNALNFTHKGKVQTSVELVQKQKQQATIRLTVQDTGIGIPIDKQDEIFTRFKRLTPSFKGIYKGAGLGLSIIKQFVDDLEGEIYVESQPDKGATFVCVIPLQLALIQDSSGIHDEPIALPITTTTSKQPSTKKSIKSAATVKDKNNILVVEDDAFMGEVNRTILEKLDCNVDIAVEGKEAIKAIYSKQYDMVFMDIGLPDMDGYEVTKKIRQYEIDKERLTPIIALSAHSGADNAQQCIAVGMNAVLTKPLIPEKALDILNTFIPSRTKEKQAANNKKEDVSNKENEINGEVVNIELVKKNYDEKLLSTIFGSVLKNFPDEQKNLIAAYDSKDWNLLRQRAHKIRGTAAYCRAERTQAICGKLDEYLVDNQDVDVINKLYTEALKEIEAFYKYIENFVKKPA